VYCMDSWIQRSVAKSTNKRYDILELDFSGPLLYDVRFFRFEISTCLIKQRVAALR
jgi:hypothetical protein